tara:strand:+ start:1076 stop:1546 length:471 start_codon:yes stop_codon:yes gene_type:complete
MTTPTKSNIRINCEGSTKNFIAYYSSKRRMTLELNGTSSEVQKLNSLTINELINKYKLEIGNIRFIGKELNEEDSKSTLNLVFLKVDDTLEQIEKTIKDISDKYSIEFTWEKIIVTNELEENDIYVSNHQMEYEPASGKPCCIDVIPVSEDNDDNI